MKKRFIPYGHQSIDAQDIKAVVRVLKSEWLTQGPNVSVFEKALCAYTGAKYAVAVANGTAALHVACLAAGISKDDEAITSPITFLASSNSVLYTGGKPVFCDVEPDTANIDASKIENLITPRTKMLIPVHYSGHPCDMENIRKIADKHKLLVLEDAAHALGSKVKVKDKWYMTGSCGYSDMTVLSFHPVKHITTGEGGAILTNREDIYEKLLVFRNHGMTKKNFVNTSHGDWYYEMQELGFNYRITDIQCALGSSQLKKLGKFVKRRKKIVDTYNKAFKNNSNILTPPELPYGYSSHHLYPIRLSEKIVPKRKGIVSQLRARGIGAQIHYIPVYLQPYYERLGYKKGLCPVAERFYWSEISFPIYPSMTDKDIKYVIENVETVLHES